MKNDYNFYADVNPDAPKVSVHSIPHTGTRFVVKFFEGHGTPIWHRHLYDKQWRPEWQRIIPVRDPYDCWKSWAARRRNQFTDIQFVSMWAEFIMRTEHQDAFYFPLDIKEAKRQRMLMEAVDFIGAEKNMAYIKSFANDWKPVGATLTQDRRDAMLLPNDVREALSFAHQWYQHYTIYWGRHLRNPKSMMGEPNGGN